MQLYGSFRSPYVRKVRVVIAELGLTDRIPMDAMDPSEMPPHLVAANPLSKVPTLLLDDGRMVIDSPVICEMLDAEFGGGRLLPKGPARWSVLSTMALADGVVDAGQMLRTERLLPEAERRANVIEKQTGKIVRGLDRLDSDDSWRKAAGPDLGQIAVGVALGWLNYRMPDFLPAGSRPALMGWYATFSQRPSMQGTVPPK